MKYSVSARKREEYHIKETANDAFRKYGVQLEEIENFYGFLEYSPLYGGKPYVGREISDVDLDFMYDNNIGLRIPLTNLFVTYDEYKSQKEFLKKYHRNGNSIITVSDDLARWIRSDFPEYKLEASIIKRIRTPEALERAFQLYDKVIPDCSIFGFSFKDICEIKEKDRIILFVNLMCENFCKSQKCYIDISKMNKNPTGEKFFVCYRPERNNDPKILYNKDELVKAGFSHFKIVFGNPILRGKFKYLVQEN